jgi:hypothetical protein
LVVARVYGGEGSRIVELPDGQLGWPSGMEYTDAPFVPATAQQVQEALLSGALKGYKVLPSPHHLIFFKSSHAFAKASSDLLDSLYKGLVAKFTELGLAVREPEFPLVVVIHRTEEDFRAHNSVSPDVQAFYHMISNRVHLYETSERDETAPDVAARRRPQTVAHEGTHQILQNIGVHPRLAPWPVWLIEGLAEYCAPTTTSRGGGWSGFNKINPFHMATLRDLSDAHSLQAQPRGRPRTNAVRGPEPVSFQSVLTKTHFDHTDYAVAWGLTYYLANKKFEPFIAYLKEMGRLSPLARRTPEENLATFRTYFGNDPPGLDKSAAKYLASLKRYDPLPYYAVTFVQELSPTVIYRAAIVSQSPALISQWLDEMTSPRGGAVIWHASPFPTRIRANAAAEQWIAGQ